LKLHPHQASTIIDGPPDSDVTLPICGSAPDRA